MKRHITEIILHCTATRAGKDFSATDIDTWHRKRGFNGIGYHWVIRLDGTIERGRPEERIGAHCVGHNAHSIGITYVGGLDTQGNCADTRTSPQKESMAALVEKLCQENPGATVHGHNEFAAKACPCFNARKEYSHLEIKKLQ